MIGARSRSWLVLLLLAACNPSRERARSTSPADGADTPRAVDARPCTALEERLCHQFGADSDECRLVRERTASLASDRCRAMLAHYDDIARSTTRLVEGRKELGSADQNTSHGPAPTLGSPGAPITMVFFGDFGSPACARGAPIANAVNNLHHDDVRLVFRQFPLSGNPNSRLAAEASLAAQAQGKFWRLYDVLFGNPQSDDRAALERYAAAAGLDLADLDRALDTHEFAADVDADRELGNKLDVIELPALFVNGARVSFPYGESELAEVIADAHKSARHE